MKTIAHYVQFFKEVRVEMAKVTWPTIPEFLGATMVVLIIMVAFSLYLGGIDYIFAFLVDKVWKASFF